MRYIYCHKDEAELLKALASCGVTVLNSVLYLPTNKEEGKEERMVVAAVVTEDIPSALALKRKLNEKLGLVRYVNTKPDVPISNKPTE